MVHICCRHSGNMAEAKAERSEGTCLARIIQVRAGFCRGAGLGAALAAERIIQRDADTGWGVRGGVSPPAVRYGYLLYFVPDTGLD